jgi:hypothetical protein
VLRNQRQVRGPRGWLHERWDAYRVFAEFARSMTESLEQWGPRPRPITLEVLQPELFRAALAEGRGLVVPTAHFGGWEVGAHFLSDLGRPVNLVMAHEPNPTVRDFMHRLRTRHGINVIYSDRSVFAGLPVLEALRRHEVVGMQIDPWGLPQGAQAIESVAARRSSRRARSSSPAWRARPSSRCSPSATASAVTRCAPPDASTRRLRPTPPPRSPPRYVPTSASCASARRSG